MYKGPLFSNQHLREDEEQINEERRLHQQSSRIFPKCAPFGLKAQLYLAQGSALGSMNHPTHLAP